MADRALRCSFAFEKGKQTLVDIYPDGELVFHDEGVIPILEKYDLVASMAAGPLPPRSVPPQVKLIDLVQNSNAILMDAIFKRLLFDKKTEKLRCVIAFQAAAWAASHIDHWEETENLPLNLSKMADWAMSNYEGNHGYPPEPAYQEIVIYLDDFGVPQDTSEQMYGLYEAVGRAVGRAMDGCHRAFVKRGQEAYVLDDLRDTLAQEQKIIQEQNMTGFETGEDSVVDMGKLNEEARHIVFRWLIARLAYYQEKHDLPTIYFNYDSSVDLVMDHLVEQIIS